MEERLKKLMEMLPEELDGAILLAPVHRKYYLGIVSSAGSLIITRKKCFFIVDFRYIEMARERIKGAEVILQDKLDEQIRQIISDYKLTRIGIDIEHISLQVYKEYQDITGGRLIPEDIVERVIDGQRSIKSEEELFKIVRAKKIADRVFERILLYIRPGVRYDELQRKLGILASEEGSQRGSFGFVVSSGDNYMESDILPDYILSGKALKNGELVTLRLAALYEGYWADMSRTVCVGKCCIQQRELYEKAVIEKERIITEIGEGLKQGNKIRLNVCSTCEEVMCQEELGHGIGLEVEEGIRIWKEVTWKPEAGNVLCIGLKAGIPGKCSVRLQDMVILNKDGVRVIGDTCSAKLIEVE